MSEARYFKNKVTNEIAEYDSFMGLFYVDGKKFNDGSTIPISPMTIAGDPNWEQTTEYIPKENPVISTRKKFFNWLGL